MNGFTPRILRAFWTDFWTDMTTDCDLDLEVIVCVFIHVPTDIFLRI